MTAIQLKIMRRGVRPPVWRRDQVPDSITLADLHEVVQIAMTWTGSHLHSFEIAGVLYSTDLDAELYSVVHGDEQSSTLAGLGLSVGDRIRYEYDFGDGWDHDILIEKIDHAATPLRPVCLAGRRACPPKTAVEHGAMPISSRSSLTPHEEHEHLGEWIGLPLDPAAFDVTQVNEILTATGVTQFR